MSSFPRFWNHFYVLGLPLQHSDPRWEILAHTEALLKGHRTCRPPPHAVTLKPLNQLSHPGRRVPPPSSLPHLAAAHNPCGHKKNEIKRPLSDSTQRLFLASLDPKHPNCDRVCTTARPPSAICRTEPSVLLSLLHPPAKSSPDRSPSHRHNAQPEGEARTRNERGLGPIPIPPLTPQFTLSLAVWVQTLHFIRRSSTGPPWL